MGRVINIIRDMTNRLKTSWDLNKYDRFTIAEYFRKQGATIGENCSIVPTFLATEPYLVHIGNHVMIAQDVRFITHDGGSWIFREEDPNLQVFGPIIIEDNCVIGENVILQPNIRIGANSIIGAGSVVISDIPPNSIAMGVPARVLSSMDRYHQKCKEMWQKQCPSDIKIETGATWWTSEYLSENQMKLKTHLLKTFVPSTVLVSEKSEKIAS